MRTERRTSLRFAVPAVPTAAAAAALAVALVAPAARAQSGFALDRYEPSAAGDLFFYADRPWYNSPGESVAVRGGLLGDYAHNPLVVRQGQGGAVTSPVIDNMLVLHAQVGVAFADRLGIHLSLPVSVMQSGPSGTGAPLSAAGGPSVGDPRIGLRVRLFGHAETDAVSLHVGGDFFFDAALLGTSRRDNTTDDQFRGRIYLAGAGQAGIVRWALGAGVHIRPNVTNLAATQVGNDLFVNGALALSLIDRRFTVGPEFAVSTTLAQAFQYGAVNAELLLGAHFLVADRLLLGLGVGPGMSQGPGTPDVRGLLQIAYAPERREAAPAPPGDTDADGVLDPDDLCPTVPQGEHPDPARRGCPVGDRDHDTVLDPDDQCPDVHRGEHPDPARAGCPEGDRDHDTVLDSQDQCPDTPQGDHPDPNRAGCPDGDDDHDGVVNTQDECRNEPPGLYPDPMRAGCPLPDRDHDSVPDPVDHCPDQPGAPSTDPNRNGCPGLVEIRSGAIRLVRPVYFATNRDVILPRSFPVLRAVGEVLAATPQIHRVSIEGHTDDVGDDAANQDLSQRRANSVMRWLTQNNIAAARLEAHGFGESRPVSPITALRGRALTTARGNNRRVEFHIIDPAQPAQ